MKYARILAALSLLSLVTACARPPEQTMKWANRSAFNEYVDGLQFQDSWKAAIKAGTAKVCGKFINNTVPYLDLKGDPFVALTKKYGMMASVDTDGVDISPCVEAACADLIAAGNAKNITYPNNRWLENEEFVSNVWDEGKSVFQQIGEMNREASGKRTMRSQLDPGK